MADLFDIDALLTREGWPETPVGVIAHRLGVQRSALQRYRTSRVGRLAAEAFAHRLGYHPYEVWPEMRELTAEPTEPPAAGISSRRACFLVGVSYRQLDYWVRVGAITPTFNPSGSGNQRSWSRGDVERLDALARLVRASHNVVESGQAIRDAWRGGRPDVVEVDAGWLPDGVALTVETRSYTDITGEP